MAVLGNLQGEKRLALPSSTMIFYKYLMLFSVVLQARVQARVQGLSTASRPAGHCPNCHSGRKYLSKISGAVLLSKKYWNIAPLPQAGAFLFTSTVALRALKLPPCLNAFIDSSLIQHRLGYIFRQQRGSSLLKLATSYDPLCN
jgi:hypothetical protein